VNFIGFLLPFRLTGGTSPLELSLWLPAFARGTRELPSDAAAWNAVELGGTPESAVARAMERAVQKYGPQEWSTGVFDSKLCWAFLRCRDEGT
jgi:hypothetical protein